MIKQKNSYYSILNIILAIILLKCCKAIGSDCINVISHEQYDLGALYNSVGDYTIKVSDKVGTIYYNFCSASAIQCTNNNISSAYGVYQESSDLSSSSCVPLTMDASYYSGYDIKKYFKDKKEGVSMIYQGTIKNPGDSGTNLHLRINIICKKEQTDTWLVTNEDSKASFDEETGRYLIEGTSRSACPVYNASPVFDWLKGFEWIYVLLAVSIGQVECFFGSKIYKITLFLIGFFFATIFMAVFLFSSWHNTDSNLRNWSILIFSMLCGIAFGFMLVTLSNLGMVVAGGLLGGTIGSLLYLALLYKIESNPASLFFYNTLSVFTVFGFIFGWEFRAFILILATSFIGAQQTVRSLGMTIGGYPDEFGLAEKIRSGESISVGWQFYQYAFFIILLAIAGFYVQYIMLRKKEEVEEENELKKNLIDEQIELSEISK